MKTAEPFIIRGHHLDEYVAMVYARLSPEQAALSFSLKALLNTDLEYVADIVGTDADTIENTEAKLTATFDQFNNLDPQDPVKITFGEKDAICACCPIGGHCTALRIHRLEVGPKTLNLSWLDIKDMHGIARFKRIAENLGQQGIIEVDLIREPGYDASLTGWTRAEGYEEAIEYEDPLVTTAEVVRSVLSQWHKFGIKN